MDVLARITEKLGELLIEAEALLMDIRVLMYDSGREWCYQFIAMSCVGLALGSAVGCSIVFHLLR